MATDITIPPLGESITEAVISSWLVEDGAYVERDQDLVELETDKVTMPLPSPVAGVFKRGAAEGDTVGVGASIGSIDETAAPPAKSGAGKGAQAAAAEGSRQEAPVPEREKAAPVATAPTVAPARPTEPAGDGVHAERELTPVAHKLAEENHVDLSEVTGTGPGGRIREHDVLVWLQTRQNGAAPPQGLARTGGGAFARTVRRERMSQLRQRIAVRLVEAQHTAAMLTTFNECDMTRVMALRSKHKESFQERHGVKLGFMSFFAKAAVSALRKVPSVNASIAQGEKGAEVEYHDYCDIAFAVGTEKGLVVPVLRNVESLGFAEIESGLLELAAKAREGKLTLEDMQGGTFTISNGGVYGSMMSTPILNPPQSGILGMHNIIKRPVEHPDKPGEMALRPMMYLALSYDHRIVDGEGAVTFLKHVKECIEDPERLLLGV